MELGLGFEAGSVFVFVFGFPFFLFFLFVVRSHSFCYLLAATLACLASSRMFSVLDYPTLASIPLFVHLARSHPRDVEIPSSNAIRLHLSPISGWIRVWLFVWKTWRRSSLWEGKKIKEETKEIATRRDELARSIRHRFELD